MIIDPDLEELDNIHEILNNDQKKYHLNLKIQDLLLWHAWPKFSPKEDGNCPLKLGYLFSVINIICRIQLKSHHIIY